MLGYGGAERPPFLFFIFIMAISYFSQVFDAQIDVDDIENRPLNEVYVILDELQSYKEIYNKLWNKIPRKEVNDHPDLIEDMKVFNTLFVVTKRRAHFLNHAKVQQLTKAITIWKKRAFLLGKKLNMTNEEVKQVMVYPSGG